MLSVSTGASSGSGASGVLSNDVSADRHPQNLHAALVSTTTHGNLTFNSNGSFSYTAGSSFKGLDSFTYQTS